MKDGKKILEIASTLYCSQKGTFIEQTRKSTKSASDVEKSFMCFNGTLHLKMNTEVIFKKYKAFDEKSS